MICILQGHKPQEVKGIGRYEGRVAIICAVCNKVLESDVGKDHRQSAERRGYRDFETA